MKCALCQKNEADKRNTHYLTDGIIRSCLNLGGAKERAKGFYFDLSSEKPFVEFNFQQGTSISALEDSLGRSATEEEIEKAKAIPFSVDNVFCTSCEQQFTEIESQFIQEFLPKFRDTENLGKSISFVNIRLLRLFYYLQIWRTAICDSRLKISTEALEKLRKIILEHKKLEDKDLAIFPMAVTYLETIGGQDEYTSNFVGFLEHQNPVLIFLNDFVIQFFEHEKCVQHFDFFGLNDQSEQGKFINIQENEFAIKILPNECRKVFLSDFMQAEKVNQVLDDCSNYFRLFWNKLVGSDPPKQTVDEYLGVLVGASSKEILKYTPEKVRQVMAQFVLSKINY